MTVRKIGVTVGDPHSAMRAAKYSLEKAESPAAFASKYYTAEECALAAERPNVFWLGTEGTLGKLGLERGAVVQDEELALALQGLTVDGRQVRRPGTRFVPTGEIGPDGEPVKIAEQRVNSADLTFSAPKSVSVVWCQASLELRERIERAMFVAANAALEYMMGTKPVIQGKGTPAKGWAASAALQVTARTARGDLVPAPQLHVHGVVVGVDDGDQRLRTPDTAALFKDDAPLEGGAVFRARLAEELRKLGFELEWGTGRNGRFFEIKGVPQGLIEAMSPRTREVLQMVAQIQAETGRRVTGAELGAVAMMSRQGKDKDVTAEQMMEHWDALASEFEFSLGSIEVLLGRPPRERSQEELREQARAAILARIREQGPTVSAGAARAICFEVAPIGMTLEQTGELLVELQQSGELITLDREVEIGEGEERSLEQRVLVTTREIRSLEQEVIATATAAATGAREELSVEAVAAGVGAADRSLGEGKSLDAEQREAIRTLTSGAGWGTLTGRAGTGKGPVLEAVAVAHRADGWQVIAGAVDGATAQRLGHQIKAQALTIDQVLHRERQGTLTLNDRTVVLIDEASKVGLEHWVRLARLVRRDQVRLIAIGHEGQLGAIELPGMFEQMLAEDAIPTERLTEIRRHRDPTDPSKPHPWLGTYQTLLDEGKGKDAVAMLREHDAISMHATREESMQALIEGWDVRRRNYGDPRDAILVVHGSNDDVDRVNELAQARRLKSEDLGTDSVQAVDRGYRIHAGDVVMLRESAYDIRGDDRRVENGTIGIVDSVDTRDDIVRVWLNEPGADRRLVEIDQRELRQRVKRGERQVPALRLAYAFHPFPLQGATVKDVAVLAGHWSQDKEGTYTADTRAEWHLHIHADRESLGRDATDDEVRYLRYAKRTMVSQERMASIALRVSRQKLSVELPWGEPMPGLWQDIGARTLAAARQAPERPRPSIRDALTRYRHLLGDLRTDRLATHAERLRDELREFDTDWLHARREALEDPFAALDGKAALETLRIESEKDSVNHQITAAEAEAQEFEARARHTPGLRRRQRSALADTAQTQRDIAARELDRLGGLHDAEADLRRYGRHIDNWWDSWAEDAALQLAIDDELAARHEHERGMGKDWDPRIEYEHEHEHDLEHEIDLHASEPPGLEM